MFGVPEDMKKECESRLPYEFISIIADFKPFIAN